MKTACDYVWCVITCGRVTARPVFYELVALSVAGDDDDLVGATGCFPA